MRNIILTITIALLPLVGTAHADHAPKVAVCASKVCLQEEITAAIPKAVEVLVAKGKVEATWKAIKTEKIEQKEFKKGPEWVATLFDEKQPDQKKQRLYIFITMKGYLNGSNYTGE